MATTLDAFRGALVGLRRHFLRTHHAGQPLRVLDVAQADGDLWTPLRKEFATETYWQIPAKPKRGMPKLEPAEILSQPGWRENVIDLHLKKSPWPAWTEMLRHICQPTTVFLTIGRYRDADALVLSVIGCAGMQMPLGLAKKMQPFAVPYFLHLAVEAKCTVVECGEITGYGSTRAIGIHLRPEGTPALDGDVAGGPAAADDAGSACHETDSRTVSKSCAHE